jgi:Flp pilus assembly protein TadD
VSPARPRQRASGPPAARTVHAEPPRKAPTARWAWPVAAVVGLLAAGLYANSLGGALFFDDTNAIVRNEWVRNGDPLAIVTHASWWTEGRGRGWRPVTTLTFALDHALHGLEPFGYHAVNVVLHAAVSILVLAVFARVTGAPATAAIAALLFAAHPVHTETVASVVGRAELLAAAGFFVAWLLFLRADARSARALALEAGATVVFFGALLAKENALALIAVLIAADLLYPDTSVAAILRRHARRYAALVVAALVFVAVRHVVLGPDPPGIERLDNPLIVLPLGERLLTAVKVAALYGWRLLVPITLAADYSYQQIAPVTSPLAPDFLAGLALVAGLPALAWWARRRAPDVALGAAFLVLTFAMISNLVFPIGTIMAERLIYLPSAGFCLLVGAAVMRLASRAAPSRAAAKGAAKRGPAATSRGANVGPALAASSPLSALAVPAVAIPVATLVALYGVRTWNRNLVWREPLAFFSTMVADAPLSARSHRELGSVLADAGRFAEARAEFERSLAIKPDDPATLYNLGNALLQAQDVSGAIAAYTRALAVKPDFSDAMVNLGNAESMRGDHQTALTWMTRALVLTPSSPSLHMNVANTLFRVGSNDEARREYEAALALAPDAPDILTNYGSFLLAQGDYDAAIAAYQRVEPAPTPMALVGLAAAYRAKGMAAEARSVQARAERLFPANGAVRQMAEVLRRDAAGGQGGS